MGANLSGNNIDNGDFMIKTCAADPEAGYAKEKFHADPKNGVIINEVDGPKGKRLEFSIDLSQVTLDTKLKEGDNINIIFDPITGKIEISSPNVGKVKIDDQDETFGYLNDKINVKSPLKKEISSGPNKKITISCSEKIAFGQFEAKWNDGSYEKLTNYYTYASIIGAVSNDQIGLQGVHFCLANANTGEEPTLRFWYINTTNSPQTLKLYATTDPEDWSGAEEFDVELEDYGVDTASIADVSISGLGDSPYYFLLVSDEYGEEVEGITIFDINIREE